MRDLDLTANSLIDGLLRLAAKEHVSILDSCGVRHLGSHLLIAGVRPVDTMKLTAADARSSLSQFDERLNGDLAGIFTLSYEFGQALQNIELERPTAEPDIFLSLFAALIVHDYDTGRTRVAGDAKKCVEVAQLFVGASDSRVPARSTGSSPVELHSSFTRDGYLAAVERIRESIRAGDTYQTNLTQQITCRVPEGTDPATIFRRLRTEHPAPFAAFITRGDSTVVSASPERFFCTSRDGRISASPIKGTRPRGTTIEEDERLRDELSSSEKDRAENTMIVDLLRNDLGRVCDFGSVVVEKLCEIEEHPSLYHLVSTVSGQLRDGATLGEILAAAFPCGSITGAPKIRTMQIISEIEPVSRGLSMGAIGVSIPRSWEWAGDILVDVSVAIRTMVFEDNGVTFNVGGGVVIDSDPATEYEESLLKAKALLQALGNGELNLKNEI